MLKVAKWNMYSAILVELPAHSEPITAGPVIFALKLLVFLK
jgi:hypothetical protein